MRFSVIEVPARVKLPAMLFWSIIFISSCSSLVTRELKRFSDHFLAFLPQRLGVFCIQRVSAHSVGHGLDTYRGWNDLAHVAVLTIPASDLIGGSYSTSPHRSCCALRDGLPLKQSLALRRELLIPLFDDLFDLAGVYVATHLGVYHSGMHGRSTYTAIPMAFVEGNREENIRRLGSSVGNEGLIRSPLKVGILEVDIRIAVTQRRKIDQTPARANKPRDPVD